MKLFMVALLTGALLAQGPGKSMIRVISAGQGWSVDGRALERGKWIAGISSVTGRAHGDGLILDCGTKGWLAYTCGNDSCRFPVCADKIANLVQRVDLAGEDPRGIEWLVPMLTSLFRREPRDVVTLGVRSVGVADGLAFQDRDDTHWAPVLDRVLDGTHCFRLTSLPTKTGKHGRYFIVNWRHSDAASGTAKTRSLRPGLYSVAEGIVGAGATCTERPGTKSAWVLVVAAADYERIDSEWKRASLQFDRIASTADPSAVETVRRAFLAYWADNTKAR
jgi:hypothetical protein